jgi:hypothetical protein
MIIIKNILSKNFDRYNQRTEYIVVITYFHIARFSEASHLQMKK